MWATMSEIVNFTWEEASSDWGLNPEYDRHEKHKVERTLISGIIQ